MTLPGVLRFHNVGIKKTSLSDNIYNTGEKATNRPPDLYFSKPECGIGNSNMQAYKS